MAATSSTHFRIPLCLMSLLSAIPPFYASDLTLRRRVRERQRREAALDLRPRRFEPGRQHERLTEMRGILVDSEPRSFRRDLEQHSTGLLEVHRLEPEAIDH